MGVGQHFTLPGDNDYVSNPQRYSLRNVRVALKNTSQDCFNLCYCFFLRQRGKTKRETLFVYFSSLFMCQCYHPRNSHLLKKDVTKFERCPF